MPEILFSRNERNYTDTSFDTGTLLVSDFVDPTTVGDYRVRFEIISLSPGASLTVTYVIGHSGSTEGSCTLVFDAVGKHEIGFGRGDMDATTTISASLVVVGTIRASVDVVSIAQGEFVPEVW